MGGARGNRSAERKLLALDDNSVAGGAVIGQRVRSIGGRAVALGLPHYLVSILAIQGTTYAAQLIMARMLGPHDFGVVRSVEAIVAIALVFGSAGMPSLAIKSIAEAAEEGTRGRVLQRLLTLAIAVGILTALVTAAISGLFFDATTTDFARALVWLVPISAIARTALNYHQGVKSVHRVALLAAVMSVVSLILTVVLVDGWRLTGWIGARYLSEALLAGTMLWTVRRVLTARMSAPAEFSYGSLLHLGIAIAASLLVRTGVDNLGVLAMGYVGVARSDIGYFGVASLIASALLLVPGALSNLSLPAIIESFGVRRRVERTAMKLLLAGLAFSLPLVAVLMWLAPVLARVFAPAYLPGIPIIRILMLAVPLRAATSTAGAVLLAAGRVHSTLVINLLTLAVGFAALGLLVPAHGATGAAIATVVMETCSTLAAVGWAVRAVRLGPVTRLAQA